MKMRLLSEVRLDALNYRLEKERERELEQQQKQPAAEAKAQEVQKAEVMPPKAAPLAKPLDPQQALYAELTRHKEQIQLSIPKGTKLTAEKIISVLMNATGRNESLLKCTPISIVRAVKQAAELGLEIAGPLGEAYLVPFKRRWKDEHGNWREQSEAQFIMGYRGIIALATRTRAVKTISARVVHENDVFDVNLAEETIVHKPNLKNPGGVCAAYAIAVLGEGLKKVEVMSVDQLEEIRKRSKTYDDQTGISDGPWRTDYEEMCRKTVVRRLGKYLGLSAAALEEETPMPEFVAATGLPALPARTIDADGVVTEG